MHTALSTLTVIFQGNIRGFRVQVSLQLLTHVISQPQQPGLLEINPDAVTLLLLLTLMAPFLCDNPLWILSSRDSDTLTCIP